MTPFSNPLFFQSPLCSRIYSPKMLPPPATSSSSVFQFQLWTRGRQRLPHTLLSVPSPMILMDILLGVCSPRPPTTFFEVFPTLDRPFDSPPRHDPGIPEWPSTNTPLKTWPALSHVSLGYSRARDPFQQSYARPGHQPGHERASYTRSLDAAHHRLTILGEQNFVLWTVSVSPDLPLHGESTSRRDGPISSLSVGSSGSFLALSPLEQFVLVLNKVLPDNTLREKSLTSEQRSALLGACMMERWKKVRFLV